MHTVQEDDDAREDQWTCVVLVEGCWVSSARVRCRWCLLREGGAVSALLSVADPTPKVPHHQRITKEEAVVSVALLSLFGHLRVLHSVYPCSSLA